MAKHHLNDLIRSMTMSEKRYFKIFATKHVIGEINQYELLFDAIDQQEEPDDKVLLAHDFVKNLSAEKNYLYQLVLRSLNAYHSKLNTKTKIYQWLQNIEILYQKGLYEQASKLVVTAKKAAIASELFTHLKVIQELEVELLSKQFLYAEASEKIIDGRQTLELISNFEAIQKITTDCYQEQINTGVSRSDQDEIGLTRFIQNQQINNPDFPQSNRAEMYRLGLNLTHAYYTGNKNKTLEFTQKMTDLYEKQPFLITYSTIGYVSSLYNLSNAYFSDQQTEKALDTLKKLIAVKENSTVRSSPNICARIFFYYHNLLLGYYLKADKYDLVGKITANNQDEFNHLKLFIGKPQLYEYYFLLAKHQFVMGQFKKSLHYTNEIINDLKFDIRSDLSTVVRLLNLLIHFELNNDFTLEYLTQNTFNYFKKKQRLFKIETELIQFMKHQKKVYNNKLLAKDLVQLKTQMNELKRDKHEKRAFDMFDFAYWAESKLQGKLIAEMVAE